MQGLRYLSTHQLRAHVRNLSYGYESYIALVFAQFSGSKSFLQDALTQLLRRKALIAYVLKAQ